jgi:arylsulfatase A-like enzyme
MRLPDGPPTLAELLADTGYLTAAVSCNDLVGPVTGLTRGYQRVVEERDSAPAGFDRSLTERAVSAVRPLRRRAERHHQARRFAGDHGGRRATDLIDRILRETPPNRPLHLFVNYLETHLPYQPPRDAVVPFLPAGASLEDARVVDQNALPDATGVYVYSERDRELLRALYRGALRYVDGLVGRLLGLLETAGRLHGLMDHHCSLHDSVLRIPLMVRFPGAAQAGCREDLASLVDVLPTVCEVVGIPAPPNQGEPLSGPLQRAFAIAEYLAPHPVVGTKPQQHPHIDWSRYDRGLRSIRTATRKYIMASDGRHEFYDLAADPMETVNLVGTHPDELEMARALRRWEIEEAGVPTASVSPDAALRQRLATLGYID